MCGSASTRVDDARGGEASHRRPERGEATRLEREQAYRPVRERRHEHRDRIVRANASPPGRRRPTTRNTGAPTGNPRLGASRPLVGVEPVGVAAHERLDGGIARRASSARSRARPAAPSRRPPSRSPVPARARRAPAGGRRGRRRGSPPGRARRRRGPARRRARPRGPRPRASGTRPRRPARTGTVGDATDPLLHPLRAAAPDAERRRAARAAAPRRLAHHAPHLAAREARNSRRTPRTPPGAPHARQTGAMP